MEYFPPHWTFFGEWVRDSDLTVPFHLDIEFLSFVPVSLNPRFSNVRRAPISNSFRALLSQGFSPGLSPGLTHRKVSLSNPV